MVVSKKLNHHFFIDSIILLVNNPLKDNYALKEDHDAKLDQK